MLHWFRARAASIAAIAGLALTAAIGSSIAPHQDDCHDALCASVAAVPHDPSAHSVGRAPSETERPLHCVLCHWARTFRPRPEARVVSSSSAAAPLALPLQLFVTAAGAPVSQPPLRSPPAFPSVA